MHADMIVCIDDRNGISRNNKIPWYHREDILHFRNMATSRICLFGRKTWDSISDSGKRFLFSNAKVFVMTRSVPWDEFEEFAELHKDRSVLICGGQDIYQLAFEKCTVDRLYITRIPGDFECDRWFRLPPNYFMSSEQFVDGATFQEYVRAGRD